jgi:hypothetical protein
MICVASFKSLKKVVGFVSQRYGSADPDPHQNVMDPQQCKINSTDSIVRRKCDEVDMHTVLIWPALLKPLPVCPLMYVASVVDTSKRF